MSLAGAEGLSVELSPLDTRTTRTRRSGPRAGLTRPRPVSVTPDWRNAGWPVTLFYSAESCMRQNRPYGKIRLVIRTAGPSRHEVPRMTAPQAPQPSPPRPSLPCSARGAARAVPPPIPAPSRSDHSTNRQLSNIAGGGQGVTEALNGNVYGSVFPRRRRHDSAQLASYDVSEDG